LSAVKKLQIQSSHDKYSIKEYFMAKIVEDVIVIKISQLVKDEAADQTSAVTPEVEAALEQVAQELVGAGAVVEVMKA
jgi:hypothetical protein